MSKRFNPDTLPAGKGREYGAHRQDRIARTGGLGLVKQLLKPIPIIGSLFAVGLAAHKIRKKGLLGVIDVGLDVTPGVGIAKKAVEICRGDLIPDKPGKGS